MNRAITWVFQTPARLALAVFLLVGGMVAVGFAIQEPRTTPRPAATSAPTPVLDQDAAVDAAKAFVDDWCAYNGRTPQQWVDDLRARSTPELAREWTVNQEPSGDCWLGLVDVRWITATSALLAVPTTDRRPALVTVVQSGDRVLVARLDKDNEAAGYGDI